MAAATVASASLDSNDHSTALIEEEEQQEHVREESTTRNDDTTTMEQHSQLINHHHDDNHSASSSSALPWSEEDYIFQNKTHRRWNAIVVGVAAAAMVFAILSMVAWSRFFWLTLVTFLIPLFTSPYVIYQRRQLIRLPTLRGLLNRTRYVANRLMIQNSKFAKENDRLQQETERLRRIEFQLYQACEASGSAVQELRHLIQDNGAVLMEMKKIQDARELQDMLSAILMSDSDQDFYLSEEEMDRLMLRLHCFNVVDEERLKRALRCMSLSRPAAATTTTTTTTTVSSPRSSSVRRNAVRLTAGGPAALRRAVPRSLFYEDANLDEPPLDEEWGQTQGAWTCMSGWMV